MGRRNGEHGRTKWRNETRRGRERKNLPVQTVPVRWDQALSMQCDAPKGRERGQEGELRLSKEADSDATECAAMRCDRWFISVSAGVGRYPSPWQVPGKVAGAGAGARCSSQWRMRYWAGVLWEAGGARVKNKETAVQ
jgi:hypothetical protein